MRTISHKGLSSIRRPRSKAEVFFLFAAALYLMFSRQGSVSAEILKIKTSDLAMNISAGKRVSVHYKDILMFPSICGFFEIYKHDAAGKRLRVDTGPWNGLTTGLLEKSTNGFSINGLATQEGYAYHLECRLTGPDEFDVTYHFSSIPRNSFVNIEIVKLAAEIFKGAEILSLPKNHLEPTYLSEMPNSVDQRILAKGKNKIVFRTPIMDVEISDLNASQSLNLADFRNVQWDPYQSFFVYVDTKALPAANNIRLVYHIAFKPKQSSAPPTTQLQIVEVDSGGTLKATSPNSNTAIGSNQLEASVVGAPGGGATALPEQKTEEWSRFCIEPKFVQRGSGYFLLDKNSSVFVGLERESTKRIIAEEMERKIGGHRRADLRPDGEGTGSIIITKQEKIMHAGGLLPQEGFEIIVSKNAVHINGVDERGCLYGFWALLQLLNNQEDQWRVPIGIYRDWPDLKVRGFVVEMLAPFRTDTALFRKYLLSLSKARANLVVFYHLPDQIINWKKEQTKAGWSKDQMRQISAFAAGLEMEIWAGMSHKFNKKDCPAGMIKDGTNIYNPFDRKAYEYLHPLYEELLAVYKPSHVLIGHDEIRGLNEYTMAGKYSAAELLSASVKEAETWFGERGIGIAIWGDMLLDHRKWEEAAGNANSLNPIYRSGATHPAVDTLPHDIKIMDWHYQAKPEYGTSAYFAEKGFPVYGCVWHEPQSAKHMAMSIQKAGGQGLIGTDWGFWRTLSPAATTLYSLMCAWHTACVVDSQADMILLAETLREEHSSEKMIQKPVPLEAVSNALTADISNGIYNTGAYIDLRLFPSGEVVFDKTRFHVLPHTNGKIPNCIIVGADGAGRPDPDSEIVIPMNKRKFNSIQFLHTMLHRDPQYQSRKLGYYQIRYTDGTKAQVDLVEGLNITDIRLSPGLRKNDWTFSRHPEILLGSKCAWLGESATGVPLNVQSLCFRNPHPEKELKDIVVAADAVHEEYRIIVLGVTLIE